MMNNLTFKYNAKDLLSQLGEVDIDMSTTKFLSTPHINKCI